MELIFFIAACMVLCSTFVTKTVLVAYLCLQQPFLTGWLGIKLVVLSGCFCLASVCVCFFFSFFPIVVVYVFLQILNCLSLRGGFFLVFAPPVFSPILLGK